jgi:hypothetical protein
MGFNGQGWPRLVYVLACAGIAALLAGLAIWFSSDRRVATDLRRRHDLRLRGAEGGLAAGAVAGAARASVRSTALRLAIGNIHRPGALTPSVVLSLGLGLTLLVTLALIEGNLRKQIAGNLPEQAPNFFFVDIQNREIEDFSALVRAQAPEGELATVPMLRGRIMELNGIDVREIEVPPEGAWVLRGDRGITYARDVPENSTLVEGDLVGGRPRWRAAGLLLRPGGARDRPVIGDTVTVNVLGRNVTATIANLREVQWESLGINFVMVFSPNTFAGAPHAWLATLADRATPPSRRIARPAGRHAGISLAVTSVRVKDALDIVNDIIAQLAVAIRAAAGVALIASVLVLAGALAAGNRARIHDAVVLKTLGATRRTLIAAFTLEYALIGLATAIFALLAGGVAGWFVVARIMGLPSISCRRSRSTIVVALVLTVGIRPDRAPGAFSATRPRPCCAICDCHRSLIGKTYGQSPPFVNQIFAQCTNSVFTHGHCRSCSCREECAYSFRHAGVPPAAPGRLPDTRRDMSTQEVIMADLRNYQARVAEPPARGPTPHRRGPARLYAQGLQPDGAGSGDHRRRRAGDGVAGDHVRPVPGRRHTWQRTHADRASARPSTARPCAGSSCSPRWHSSSSCRSVHKLSVPAAQGTFWAFAALMGISLSSIFLVYTAQSIVQTFFITATAFGALSLWGYTTKRDLTGWGSFLIMGVFGLIIAMIVNIFLQSPPCSSPSRRSACWSSPA